MDDATELVHGLNECSQGAYHILMYPFFLIIRQNLA